MTRLRVLVIGGGDIGSAIAHLLFRRGASVLVCERPQSPHARRGMAFTDALFDGRATLDGVEARLLPDAASVETCWSAAQVVPVTTVPESELLRTLRFDAVINATMRRQQAPGDLRGMAEVTVGLGPGYEPGRNCHIAIETQWGDAMGRVLRDRAAAERSGGPRALDGVTRERFAVAPVTGVWHTQASLGQPVRSGDAVGRLEAHIIRAPISGHLRGITHDGAQVTSGQRLLEVDPRAAPQVHGLGERPLAIALGVAQALLGEQVTSGCASS
jgi:xanthine dehydrogenase accessory factor